MRKQLDLSGVLGRSTSTYQIKVDALALEMIRRSFDSSGLTWPEWISQGFAMLLAQGDDEMATLLSVSGRATDELHTLSFRIYAETLASVKRLADRFDSSIALVLMHAMFLRSVKVDLATAEGAS